MANRYFKTKKNPHARVVMLISQKVEIEKHYTFVSCKIEEGILVCSGKIEQDTFTNKYKFEIRCVCGSEPYVKILEPREIVPCKAIHMYEDHSLCLHYPPDMKWTSRTPIYMYTIPWIYEWMVYYELYLINGGDWEGPESPVHFKERDKNTFVDNYDKI